MAELKHLWCLKNGLLSFHLAPPLVRLLNCGWNKRAQGLPQAKHKARSLYLSHVGRQEVQATWVFLPWYFDPLSVVSDVFWYCLYKQSRVSEDTSYRGFFLLIVLGFLYQCMYLSIMFLFFLSCKCSI